MKDAEDFVAANDGVDFEQDTVFAVVFDEGVSQFSVFGKAAGEGFGRVVAAMLEVAVAYGAFVLVGEAVERHVEDRTATRAGQASEDAFGNHVVGQLEQIGAVEGHAVFGKPCVEGLGLWERARESVEDETLVAANPVLCDFEGKFVGEKLALRCPELRFFPEYCASRRLFTHDGSSRGGGDAKR